MSSWRAPIATLPFLAACTLLAPSDDYLMGVHPEGGGSPSEGGVAADSATIGSSGDSSSGAPGKDASTTLDSGRDTGTSGGSGPACAACQRLAPSCLANPSCECLRPQLCTNNSACNQAGSLLNISCSSDAVMVSCSGDTAAGTLGCSVGGATCQCK